MRTSFFLALFGAAASALAATTSSTATGTATKTAAPSHDHDHGHDHGAPAPAPTTTTTAAPAHDHDHGAPAPAPTTTTAAPAHDHGHDDDDDHHHDMPGMPTTSGTKACTPKAHTHIEGCRTLSCVLPTATCDALATTSAVVTKTTTQTFVEGCETHVQVGVTPCPTCPKCR